MKRTIWAALGVVIVALAVPAAALATHHHHRGVSRGERRHLRNGAATGATGAGSVSSYQDGTLDLALAGGGSITGAVTDQTRFACIGEGFEHHRFGRGGGRFDWHRDAGSTGDSGPTGQGGLTGQSGPTGSTGWTGHGRGHGWGGTSGDTGASGATGDTGGWSGHTPPPPCDSSLLVSGAEILSADVELTAHGAFFGAIVLLPAVQ